MLQKLTNRKIRNIRSMQFECQRLTLKSANSVSKMSAFSRIDPSSLSSYQLQTDNIRNFCILAHVDHGKTTLSDSLVCTNGVISPKLAGKLRFLDSTEEEQRRGITMHSSAISLLYQVEKSKPHVQEGISSTDSDIHTEEYLINLVDSPGHIDFSSDVSAATRLCDGALIVIDVLEGLCTQTHAVLHKALKERMSPCLVLNKIDRLMLEMKLSTVEAFHHLRRIIENANALAYSLLTSEMRLLAEVNQTDPQEVDENNPLTKVWTFSPELGNVIFCSALDCWGFGLPKFANIWAKKLSINNKVLLKYLFEDYAFLPKTKKIVKCDPSDMSSKPMFATMILDPIWQLYDAGVLQQDPAKAATMAQKGLNVELPPREISTRDPRSTIQSIFRRWLPLSDAILRMVVRCMPSPRSAQNTRMATLMQSPPALQQQEEQKQLSTTIPSAGIPPVILRRMQKVYNDVKGCNCPSHPDGSGDASDVVVFISKMMPVKVSELSARDVAILNRQLFSRLQVESPNETIDPSTVKLDPASEIFVALGRVFSGVLKRDSNLFVLGHRHDPLDMLQYDTDKFQSQLDVDHSDMPVISMEESSAKRVPNNSFGMYLCLGPSVYPVEEVHAGNVVGIIGLDDLVLKTATLCSTWASYPMKAITFQAKPMVRVALEPLSHQDLNKVEAGLKALYQYDPVVEVGVDDSGQHIMTCLGELHLELCLKMLIDRFSKCEVKASEPLVSFRETILPQSLSEMTVSHNAIPKSSIRLSSAIGDCINPNIRKNLPQPWCDLASLDQTMHGRYRLTTANGSLAVVFRCFPIPRETAQLLETNPTKVGHLSDLLAKYIWNSSSNDLESSHDEKSSFESYWNDSRLMADENSEQYTWKKICDSLSAAAPWDNNHAPIDGALKYNSDDGHDLLNRILCFGPRNCGSNLICLDSQAIVELWDITVPILTNDVSSSPDTAGADGGCNQFLGEVQFVSHEHLFRRLWQKIHRAIVAGFQVASNAGPLMHEPLHGVGYAVERVEYSIRAIGSDLSSSDLVTIAASNNISTSKEALLSALDNHSCNSSLGTNPVRPTVAQGQLISEVIEALRLSMLSCSLRIVEPIYACNLQCDQSQLGNLYSVLSKRRGEVSKEDVIDGTSLFILSATLPVAESFGFAQELLKKTSGNGTAPQLLFSHWENMDIDPFWKPATADEREEFGDHIANDANKARMLVDKIRKRKGLAIEEKVVMFAEKQRTLKKN